MFKRVDFRNIFKILVTFIVALICAASSAIVAYTLWDNFEWFRIITCILVSATWIFLWCEIAYRFVFKKHKLKDM